MSLCDIFPDDPSCAPAEPEPVAVSDPADEPEPAEKVDDVTDEGGDDDGDAELAELEEAVDAPKDMSGGWLERTSKVKALHELSSRDPMMAQVTYLLTAGGVALNFALNSFVWHSSTASKDDYKKGEMKSGDTNLWSLGHTIGHYSAICIFGVAMVTQLLAIFGIAVPINGIVWHYGVHLVLYIIENVATILNILAMDKAHTYLSDKTTASSVLANAGVVYGGALGDFIEHQAHFVLTEMAMWSNLEDWELSQWLGSTPEAQAKMIESLEEKLEKLEEQFATEGVKEEGAEEGAEEEEEGKEASEGDEEAAEGEGDEE